jgi:hypothetical protein
VQRARSRWAKDYFVGYCAQGKRSYYIASTYDDDACKDESAVLRRLSDEFELCAYGLHHVRKEFESLHADGESGKVIG